MNKLKYNDFFILKNASTVQIFYYLQNHLNFHSEEMLANFVRGRECFVGLSLILVYSCGTVVMANGVDVVALKNALEKLSSLFLE